MKLFFRIEMSLLALWLLVGLAMAAWETYKGYRDKRRWIGWGKFLELFLLGPIDLLPM